jgi:hypothetical protein
MIFLPVRLGWLHATEDLVVVDEAQDMTNAKLKIARGICKGRPRSWSATTGKRSTSSWAPPRTASSPHGRGLNATQLGLTTTYRCGKAIVDLAAEMVPDFEAGPDNPEGR